MTLACVLLLACPCPPHSDRPRWHEAAVTRVKTCLSARLTAALCQRLIIKQQQQQQQQQSCSLLTAAADHTQHKPICNHFMPLISGKRAPSLESLAASDTAE